ncbi:hypothetical protein HD554DRAFT_2038074 [Boletus coccyginus]|nr:hypothetical protein HD554DRAFT_2038074 [Boletus coccyginus]
MNVIHIIRDAFARPGVLRDCGLRLSSVAIDNRPTPVLSRTLLSRRRYVGDKKECHGAGPIWAFMRTRTHLLSRVAFEKRMGVTIVDRVEAGGSFPSREEKIGVTVKATVEYKRHTAFRQCRVVNNRESPLTSKTNGQILHRSAPIGVKVEIENMIVGSCSAGATVRGMNSPQLRDSNTIGRKAGEGATGKVEPQLYKESGVAPPAILQASSFRGGAEALHGAGATHLEWITM